MCLHAGCVALKDMMLNIEIVFNRLASVDLKLKAQKCNLFTQEVEYLEHVISEDGV